MPIDDRHMMIDLIARLGMPVVLAARSGLGTINHTLLSLERCAAEASGAGRGHERPAVARQQGSHRTFWRSPRAGRDPPLARVDAAAVAELARGIAPLADCLAALEGLEGGSGD